MIHGTRTQQLEKLRGQGWRIVTFKNAPVVVAWQEMAGKIHAKGWAGKADKPAWYYTFRTLATAQEYASRFAFSQQQHAETTAARAAARKSVTAAEHWAVGDVVYNSWGYDQTNVDFYQVVEVKAKSVVLRAINQSSSDRQGSPSGGYTQPCRGEFCGEPFAKIVGREGRLSFEFGGGSKWDGKAKYTSSYH